MLTGKQVQNLLGFTKMIPTPASSVISSFGYDTFEKILIVTMKETGAVYAYFDVPRQEFLAMYEAKSTGTFYNENVQGKYSSDKISD